MRGFFSGVCKVGAATTPTQPYLGAVTFNPVGGAYPVNDFPFNVAIGAPIANSYVFLTWDGSIPSLYHYNWYRLGGGTIPNVNAGITLKAVAWAPGYNQSAVYSATYTSSQTCSAPAFVPIPSPYPDGSFPLAVMAYSRTPGCTIRYTVDGTTPTNLVGQAIANYGTAYVPANPAFPLKAIAFKTGMANSAVTSGTYTAQHLAAPVVSPPHGYADANNRMTVLISTVEAGAEIWWTNGKTGGCPNPSPGHGNRIVGPSGQASFIVDDVTGHDLKAIVVKPGYVNSPINTAGPYQQRP